MNAPLKVTVFRAAWDVPVSASPFCLKLVSWLQLAEVPYEIDQLTGPPKSKTGKVPYATFGDGTVEYDSSRIIDRVRREYETSLDDTLSADERAVSTAFIRMLEEHAYWSAVYQRWIKEENFPAVRDAYFPEVPSIMRSVVASTVRRSVKKSAYGQGLARHTWSDIVDRVRGDFEALNQLLGDGPWYFNNPSTLDVVSYAFVENVISAPFRDELYDAAAVNTELVAHTERMRNRLWENLGSLS